MTCWLFFKKKTKIKIACQIWCSHADRLGLLWIFFSGESCSFQSHPAILLHRWVLVKTWVVLPLHQSQQIPFTSVFQQQCVPLTCQWTPTEMCYNTQFWMLALCDITKGNYTPLRLVTTPPSQVSVHPSQTASQPACLCPLPNTSKVHHQF